MINRKDCCESGPRLVLLVPGKDQSSRKFHRGGRRDGGFVQQGIAPNTTVADIACVLPQVLLQRVHVRTQVTSV